MVNAPTRPPAQRSKRRSERRPPRGPRTVALRPTAKDLKTKALLEAASVKLREVGEPGMADAVDTVLSPKGWPMLGRLRAAVSDGTGPETNMGMRMSPDLRDRIKDAAETAGDDLADVVNAGWRALLAGEFEPDAPARTPGPKVNLNVRPDGALRQQVDAFADAVKGEWGWTPHPSTVAVLWLVHHYGLNEPAQ